MPLLSWPAFLESHYRPFMVVGETTKGYSVQNVFTLTRQLLQSMGFVGSYSLLPDDNYINVAFELEGEATCFAQRVAGERTEGRGEWAGQWAFTFDDKTAALVAVASARRPSVGHTGRKKKKRSLPVV